MSLKDIRAKYGTSGNAHETYNKAVRAELPGGSLLLDAAERMHVELANPRRDRSPAELAALATVMRHVLAAANAARDAVKVRYGGVAGAEPPTTPPRPMLPEPPAADHIPADVVARLGKQSIGSLAAESGISGKRLTREQGRLDIVPHAATPVGGGRAQGAKGILDWSAKLDAMIRNGDPDADVAEAAGDGRSVESVRRRRIKLLGAGAKRYASWTPEADQIVRTMGVNDAPAALAKLGMTVSRRAFWVRRHRLAHAS